MTPRPDIQIVCPNCDRRFPIDAETIESVRDHIDRCPIDDPDAWVRDGW